MALPVRLSIPSIGVGLTATRAMDVPTDWHHVGWFNLGPRPGESGSAVIAGHLDSSTGPAVFWDLKKLRIGDDVSIITGSGTTQTFRVTRTAVYTTKTAPLTELFGTASGAHLNLITCAGSWDKAQGKYDERLAVYTEKVE